MAPTDASNILPPPPALPDPVKEEDAIATAVDHAAAALAVVGGLDYNPEHAVSPEDEGLECHPAPTTTPKKRNKKLPLTFHEALTFASRGIYVDIETGQVRCSCNHKPCDKWEAYGYTRHFTFKCHKKYEEERLDDAEIARLRESKATYMRMNPIVEESSIRKKRKMKEGEAILSVEELRVQERHWMEMWKDAKNELKELRRDLKEEPDEEVRAELIADIDGLKRRKGDWAKLLGLHDSSTDAVMM
eukprot:CAMPEP_0181117036 /NCGR_PEP_ID=MMETSP1071-20121207/22276_1 /TAXON_ID=35127 /ORGANISM="Thalassiosira sp., Strain NH16" /LENGTH=245 /DNA_ID=CAMNT_0023201333 /DNA_START=79 /DNA_END=816 /DNA_ORIENTATION=+